MGEAVVLVTVKAWGVLVCPNGTLPELKLEGVTVGGSGAIPVPEMFAVSVPTDEWKETGPVVAPVTVGLKERVTLQV